MLKIFETIDAESDKLCQRGGNTFFIRKILVGELKKFEMGACIDEFNVKSSKAPETIGETSQQKRSLKPAQAWR